VQLRPAERDMLDRAPTRNREAYLLYLQGRELMDQGRRASYLRAEESLRRAVELDPGFALAHATLAECYGQRATAWWGGVDLVERARPHALRAIELDPGLPEAHMAMGFVHRIEGDAEGLLREIRLAAPPDTTDPLLLRWAGWSYMTQGKPEDALAILERAHRLHPRNYRIASSLTDCYLMLGRRDDERRVLAGMREVLVEALDREPDNVDARIILAINLAQSGDREAGLAQAERALAMAPDDGRVHYNAACAFAHAGETERAIDQLRVMVELVPSYLTDWIRRDPDFASLRGHPEFIRMFGESQDRGGSGAG
jgi:adenylate cyclase